MIFADLVQISMRVAGNIKVIGFYFLGLKGGSIGGYVAGMCSDFAFMVCEHVYQ